MSKKLVVCASTFIDGIELKSMSSGVDSNHQHFCITQASYDRVSRMADNSGDRQDTETSNGTGFTFVYRQKK